MLGHPLRRASAGHEVKEVMKTYTKWRAGDMSRTCNRIALPPFKVTVNEKTKKWIQLPCDVWKVELDTFVSDRGFRRNLSTEIVLPFMYMDRWMLGVWDCKALRRDLLIFKEIELSREQWKAVSTIDNVIVPYIR